MEDFEVLKTLGKGGQGETFSVRRRRDHKYFVIKQIKCKDHKEGNQALKEVKMMQRLSHGSVVRIEDFFLSDLPDDKGSGMGLNILMEWCENGDLAHYLQDVRSRKVLVPAATVSSWFLQLADALVYIHSNEVLHRDLKPLNVFITKISTLKIGDFGLARQLEQSRMSMVGTPSYAAPEVLKSEHYGEAADMWGLGCILYEMMSLNFLWESKGLLAIKVMNTPLSANDMHTHYPQMYRQIAARMLSCRPEDRPTARQTLSLLRGETEGGKQNSKGEEEKTRGRQEDFRPFAKMNEKAKAKEEKVDKGTDGGDKGKERIARFTVPVKEQQQERVPKPTRRVADDAEILDKMKILFQASYTEEEVVSHFMTNSDLFKKYAAWNDDTLQMRSEFLEKIRKLARAVLTSMRSRPVAEAAVEEARQKFADARVRGEDDNRDKGAPDETKGGRTAGEEKGREETARNADGGMEGGEKGEGGEGKPAAQEEEEEEEEEEDIDKIELTREKMKDFIREGLEIYEKAREIGNQARKLPGDFLTLPDGSRFKGRQEADGLSGVCLRIRPIGEKYFGEFVSNRYHGCGALELPEGTKYIGQMRQGKYHGVGSIVMSNGTVTYRGHFRNGLYHGFGEYKERKGDNSIGFIAYFRNGKPVKKFDLGEGGAGAGDGSAQ